MHDDRETLAYRDSYEQRLRENERRLNGQEQV